MNTEQIEVKFEVVDKQTGQVRRTCKTAKAARNARNKLDNEYGAYRYFVRQQGTTRSMF